MARSKKDFAVLVSLVLLTGLVYANGLRNPFVIDDHSIIVRNFLLRQWTLAELMKSHLFSTIAVETQYYRPLTLLSFALNYGLSGLDPAGYRLVNIALHLLVATLSFLLLVRLPLGRRLRCCALRCAPGQCAGGQLHQLAQRSSLHELDAILPPLMGEWEQGAGSYKSPLEGFFDNLFLPCSLR